MANLIYIFTNPKMPNLIKIGRALDLEDLKQELEGLSSHEGVPVPFTCYYCCEVKNGMQSKKILHAALDNCINSEKGFFECNAEKAKKILKELSIGEVFLDSSTFYDSEQNNNLSRKKKKGPPSSFSMLDIPIGSKLTFFNYRDNVDVKEKVATVTGDREIEFEGERGAITPMTLKILKKYFGIHKKSTRGPNYWKFNNETLVEIRTRLGK